MASGSVSAPVSSAASVEWPWSVVVRIQRQGMTRAKFILVQTEVGPEINPSHLIISGKLVWCAAAEDYTVIHDVRAVGDPQRLADVVIGDEDADAARLEMEDD